MLFEQFDRLLFLAKGGRTVYFGPVGKKSQTLVNYFESNGANKCPEDANPAEWMLSAIGAAPGSESTQDWHETWRGSKEYQEVKEELQRIKTERPKEVAKAGEEKQANKEGKKSDKAAYAEFAAPLVVQFWQVLKRVFQQYWRTPSYIWSKTALCTFSVCVCRLLTFMVLC